MAPQSPANPSKPQGGSPWTKKLMPLLPVIIAGIVGFLVGMANGIAGIICSIAVGLLVSVFFIKKMSVQQALDTLQKKMATIPFYMQIVYMIGNIVLFSIFSAVITKYGLFLPDGIHNPNTLVKYLSIIWVLPSNFSKKPTYAFPGYPWLILLATIIMILGAVIPERFLNKKIKPIVTLVGIILLAAAPTITHSMLGQKGAVPWEYLPVFNLVWVGIIMIMVAVYLPLVLEKLGVSGKLPLAAGLIVPIMIPLLPLPIFYITGSFEGDHHDAAEVIEGWISALIGMHLVSQTGTTTTPPATAPEVPPTPAPPPDTTPTPGPDTTAATPANPPVGPSGYKDGTVKTYKNPLGWGDDIELVYDSSKDMWHNTTQDCWYNSLDNYQKYQKQAQDDKDWIRKDENSGHSAFNDKLNEIAQKYKDDFEKTQLAEKQKQALKDKLIDQQMKDTLEGLKANRSADNWDWAVKGASAVETAADTSIDVMAKMTGEEGTILKHAYYGIKDVAKNVSESVSNDGLSVKSVVKGTVKGAVEGAIDIGVDKASTWTGGNVPGLYDFKGYPVHKAAEVIPKTITEHLVKEAVIKEGIKSGVKDAIQSKLQSFATDPLKQKLGLGH